MAIPTTSVDAGDIESLAAKGALAGSQVIDNGDATFTVMPEGPAVRGTPVTGDALVKTGIGIYRGFNVTVVTATAAIDVRDATSAGTGTIIDTIPTGTAAGTRVHLSPGIAFTTGLFIDYGASATGTIVPLYR